ncbi:hypothetical protein CLF_107300 [Clonorchis sinensis]|uniref:Uncharacterized protein n=1 Tax=Clonorchis sinensis TaxID=79923 RepID=G7YQJ0_CLOSI|nr:hypothetical protein CLF_107300 [Clonorchis sinensis]
MHVKPGLKKGSTQTGLRQYIGTSTLLRPSTVSEAANLKNEATTRLMLALSIRTIELIFRKLRRVPDGLKHTGNGVLYSRALQTKTICNAIYIFKLVSRPTISGHKGIHHTPSLMVTKELLVKASLTRYFLGTAYGNGSTDSRLRILLVTANRTAACDADDFANCIVLKTVEKLSNQATWIRVTKSSYRSRLRDRDFERTLDISKVSAPIPAAMGKYETGDPTSEVHHEKSAEKPFAVLRMIRCTFSCITHMDFQLFHGAYVRPLFEYANPVVYSGRTKEVTLIELVQRAATKLVAGLESLDHETRLAVFDHLPLEYRRLQGGLILTPCLNKVWPTIFSPLTQQTHGERQPLNDKNKTDPGNLAESLDLEYQSVNPCLFSMGEREDLIRKFCTVANTSENEAQHLLEAFEWNYEEAIKAHFDDEDASNEVLSDRPDETINQGNSGAPPLLGRQPKLVTFDAIRSDRSADQCSVVLERTYAAINIRYLFCVQQARCNTHAHFHLMSGHLSGQIMFWTGGDISTTFKQYHYPAPITSASAGLVVPDHRQNSQQCKEMTMSFQHEFTSAELARTSCVNNRGTSLMAIAAKVFSVIILRRLIHHWEVQIHEPSSE